MSSRNKWVLWVLAVLAVLFGVALVTGTLHMPKNADYSYTHDVGNSTQVDRDPSFGVVNK